MNGILFTLLSLLALGYGPAGFQQAETQQADLIIQHAKIWTGNPKQPQAAALAAAGGRLLYVGDAEGVKQFQGPATRVMNAQGRRIVAGFHDSHVHFLAGGIFLSEVDLKDCANEEEFGKKLREFDQKLPKGRWMLGGNWDHDRAFAGVLPTAAILDKYVSPDRPVFLRRYDGHMALANSLVLKLAHITAETKDPPGGEVVRLAGAQKPSGILRDNAMDLVGSRGLIPAPDDQAIAEGVRQALREARSVGVTAVDDMDGSGRATRYKLWRLYQALEKQGELTCRIRLFWPLAEWSDFAQLIGREGRGAGLAQLGGCKGFMDGSLGSSTAKMFQPYQHEQGKTGQWVTPPSVMQSLSLAADRAGLQVVVHAIGDEANAKLLDIFSTVAEKNGPRDRRFRIEHAQHLRREDYPRFKSAEVIASMQPYHVIDDGRWAEGRIGTERCSSSYAYRSLLEEQTILSFGSDWAVAPLNPLLGIDAAVNRRPLDGKHPQGWFPAQRINVEEAVRAYTKDAAYAMFAEKDRGTLEPGKQADLVILDRDILDPAERDHLKDARVLATILAGKVVFERK
jgi:predicted amidohydrolase YtcJ